MCDLEPFSEIQSHIYKSYRYIDIKYADSHAVDSIPFMSDSQFFAETSVWCPLPPVPFSVTFVAYTIVAN